jgi:hypothetical protein
MVGVTWALIVSENNREIRAKLRLENFGTPENIRLFLREHVEQETAKPACEHSRGSKPVDPFGSVTER